MMFKPAKMRKFQGQIWIVLLLMCCTNIALSQTFTNPLYIPDTLSGTTFNLTMASSKVSFIPGDSTDTYGINASYLGKVLIMNQGDQVQMNVTNSISDTITMHWHGFHVAPEDDGGPHTMILPGTTWSPDFTIADQAATFWYHPHLHHKTAEQVYKGAAGMIIVRDTHEAALNLPRTYGVDDFPLIIQDKSFDATNKFIYTELADTMMVNGTLNPYLEVPAQMVRFRILNASNQRVYNFGLPPNIDFWQIGTDGGLLNNPIFRPRILLAPGERAEVVVNFGMLATGQSFRLKAFNSEMVDGVSGALNGPHGPPGNSLDGVDFDLIDVRVISQTANPVTSIPMTLNNFVPWDENDANRIRIKYFDVDTSGFPFYINSTPFNHMVVNDTVLLDNIEIWELRNETDVAHPFHIHDIQFYVLDINGAAPPPTLAGRKDVILLVPGDTIRFITKFDDFVDYDIPYMYHCHNLFHEDGGMMGQFIVVDSAFIGTDDPISRADFAGRFELFPNPANDHVRVKALDPATTPMVRLSIFDLLGREIQSVDLGNGVLDYDIRLNEGERGIYFLQIQDREGNLGTIRFMRY